MVVSQSTAEPRRTDAARPAEAELWRVRVVLPDRPGALARLAQECGEHAVNILGLEVHPGLGTVTDELVMAVPAAWSLVDVVTLVERAGGRPELVGRAPSSALSDQTVRHLRAVARLVERPLRAAWVVADLLDAEAVSGEAAGNSRRAEGHRLAVSVLGETMDIVRDAPFTPTEQARVDALVALADRLADVVTPPDPPDRAAGRRSEVVDGPGRAGSELGARDRLGLGGADGGPEPDRGVPTLRRHADSVIAEVADRKVGEATLHPTSAGWGVRVYVHPAWRRRGIGLQLLRDAMELARGRGLAELDVRLDAQDLAGLRLVLASGMCGSVSCDSGVTRTRLVLGRPVRART